MQKIDVPGWERAVYGFSKEDLTGGMPNGINRKQQRVGVGTDLWKDVGNGQYQFMPVNLGGIQLWNPKIRLTARKNVVETPLVELDGSVKEIINMDDYIINIKGIIKNKSGLWPDAEVAQLSDLWKRKLVVPITNALVTRFIGGSENVLITNLTIPETDGFVESVRYEIECVSDNPFVLELE